MKRLPTPLFPDPFVPLHIEMENRRLREENAQLRREQLRLVTSELPQPIVKGEKSLKQYVAELEAALVVAALKECAGDKTRAAHMLGVSPHTLYYLIERHHLDPDGRVD